MDVYNKLQLWIGMNIFSWSVFSEFMRDAYPVVSFIAVSTAAIIGVHTIGCIIFKCKKNNYPQNYYD